MGNDLYQENRRLKVRNDELERMLRERGGAVDKTRQTEIAADRICGFFSGLAHLEVVNPIGQKHIIRFVMPEKKDVD